MRKDIYNICKESLKNLEIYSKCIIIDMTSPDLCLHEEEKIKIFRTLIPQTCVDDDKLPIICKENKQIGFPQCCRVFSKYPEFQNSAESFFQDPIACLRSDLKKMFYGLEEEKQRFCVLALLAFHGGCLKFRHCYEHSCSEQDIQRLKHAAIMCGMRFSDITGNKLLDDAKSFAGVYVEYHEQKNQYTFSHSSVEKAIVNLMFERNSELMISSCKFSFFSHFTIKQERGPDTFSPKEIHYNMIVARISQEVENHKHNVFGELADIDLWRDDKFRAKVSQKLHSEDFGLHYHMQDGRNDSMSLLVCGSRAGNYYLVEFLMKFKPSNNQLQRAQDIAGRFGREKVFRFLIESGAQPSIRTFFHVIKSGDVNLFQYMLTSNIDFIAKCDLEFPGHPTSVFEQICITGNQTMAELFRSRFQVSFEARDIKRYLFHCGYGGSAQIFYYIVKQCPKFLRISLGIGDLNPACLSRSLDQVRYMFENFYYQLQTTNNDGWTNLHYAALGGSVDVAKYLIERGVAVTNVSRNKKSVLHLACQNCHLDLVKYLVQNYPCLLQMVDGNGFTVLHNAGIGGSVDVVKYLIENGVNVTEVTKNKMSVLFLACQKCHIELVKYLVENHEGLLQIVDDNGLTSLHHAGLGGSVDVVKYLIENGVNVTEVTNSKMSVLHVACIKCHYELVKYLVENHVGILQMFIDDDGLTSLHHAGIGGSVDVVKYLIKNEVNVSEVTKDKRSVLHVACNKCHDELVKYLVENHPSLLQMVDDVGFTSLHHAGLGGSVDVVKYLIENGDDVAELTKDKRSVLHVASRNCHFELVKYLVENHPSLLQIVDDNGLTSLHHAGLGGSVDVVKYLIENRDDAAEVTKNKRSVLHVASRNCHFELVKYLVENHPSLLQIVDDNGLTSLHHAGLGGSVDVVKYLIKNGDNVAEMTKDRRFLLYVASRNCHFELVKFLVENYPSMLQMVDDDGLTSLHHAGIGGSVDVVKYLIQNGMDVTEVTKKKMSVLLLACQKCHYELVKFLVKNHPSLLQMVHDNGLTSLHHAGLGGSVDVVKYLTEFGMNVKEVTKEKMSVLHVACNKCHHELVKYLVENHRSLLQMVDDNGLTSLHHAGIGGSVDVVKYLIDNGADTTEVTQRKMSVLHLACKNRHYELMKYLLENHHCLLQMIDDNGLTSLHHAGIGGSVDVVKYLIEYGVDFTEENRNKRSVLHLACTNRHFELVKYLVENHPSLLQMVDDNGLTNLHHTGIGGAVDVVKYLIENGVDTTELSKNKRSVLHVASQNCHFELVKYLVENHPSLLQMVDDNGLTSLHHAGIGGSVDVVKYLIENGVDTTELTKNKRSVLHVASQNCHFELVKFLLKNHTRLLQMEDDNGNTSLHYAGKGGSVNVVKYLIENGADTSAVTTKKRSVLHLAAQNCHFELVKYLVENQPSLLQMIDDNGLTGLHHAGIGGSVDVVKYLIQNGMDVTKVIQDKMSVLHLACGSRHYELVKYLLENHHCLLQMVDDEGLTSLHHAGIGGSVDVVKYLIEYGVYFTEITREKRTVLHLACYKCHIELVKYLVENHPSLLQMVDDNGLTSLHHAGLGGSVDVVKYLIRKGVKVTDLSLDKSTVLHVASQSGHNGLVKYLVEEHPCLLHLVNKAGFTSLHYAHQGGSIAVVQYLMSKGLKDRRVTIDDQSAFHLLYLYIDRMILRYFDGEIM